ncbi:hypothetical protein [Rhodococcus opacus]|uniref:hypothetical protein n=1 Tax=Rhodococcus opacus TaxID=37919 RepID=UPI001C4888C3|nr:hypothetical protein [Rhodococcus opacus]MBV6760812.1 hypothetical protein [Rhodococcus opacus]
MYKPFEIPTQDEVTEFHQITFERLRDSPGGYILSTSTGRDENIELAVDPLGRSIRLRYSVLSHIVLDVFREGATKLQLDEPGDKLSVVIEFEAGEIVGTLTVDIGSTISIKDSLLLR